MIYKNNIKLYKVNASHLIPYENTSKSADEKSNSLSFLQ